MPAPREEFVFTTDGTLTIWNRDTGSLRNMGQFFVDGSTDPLILLDIDVAADGTVYGVDGGALYRLNLRAGTATFEAPIGSAANALDITASGDLVVGYGLTAEIAIFSAGNYELLRTLSTERPGSSTDVLSAGDVQVVDGTVYLTGTNHELIGLNMETGETELALSDVLFSSVFGLSTAGNDLLFYAETSVYRLVENELVEIIELDLEHSVFGAADAVFPRHFFEATTGADLLQGGFYSDRLFAFAGRDTVFAGQGDDRVVAGDGRDRVNGGLGYDEVYGGAGADTLKGNFGNDTLYGGLGSDSVMGEGGRDLLGGAAGNDILLGGLGLDTMGGGLGDDLLMGGRGSDLIFGAPGSDHVYGGAGADTIFGGDDADRLSGGTGDDALFAGAGEDVLIGAVGDDTLTGGSGADRFVFARRFGEDHITDFRSMDTVDFSRVFHAATSFADLIDQYASEDGPDTTFFFASDRQVVLENTSIDELSADQFIL